MEVDVSRTRYIRGPKTCDTNDRARMHRRRLSKSRTFCLPYSYRSKENGDFRGHENLATVLVVYTLWKCACRSTKIKRPSNFEVTLLRLNRPSTRDVYDVPTRIYAEDTLGTKRSGPRVPEISFPGMPFGVDKILELNRTLERRLVIESFVRKNRDSQHYNIYLFK